MWGWVEHVGVVEHVGGVEHVRVGGACGDGWSMWGFWWNIWEMVEHVGLGGYVGVGGACVGGWWSMCGG